MGVPAEACRLLEKVYADLLVAYANWGCWADDVRQGAEKRLGVLPGDQDERIWGDPEYAAAVDAGRVISDALRRVERGLAAADPQYAAAVRAGNLQAVVSARLQVA
jgi:hypothetical protein